MEHAENGSLDTVFERLREYFPEGESIDWELLDWLESLPYYIETDDFICVYAGIPIQKDGTLLPFEKRKKNS